MKMAMLYLIIGSHVLGLACVWLYLETYSGWSSSARLTTGVIMALLLLPIVVSHIRMPAHTRGFLRDNVRYQGLFVWGSALTVVAGLVATFGPRPWVVPSTVIGFVTTSVGGWASAEVRNSVASFKEQQKTLIGTVALAMVIILLRLFDMDTIRVIIGALLFAPLPVDTLQWIVSARSVSKLGDYPGRQLLRVASGLGLAGLLVMAWTEGTWWTLISAGALLTMIVLWGAARKKNAEAGVGLLRWYGVDRGMADLAAVVRSTVEAVYNALRG